MTHHVVVTAAAKQNLRDAYRWTAERAPVTAANWLNRFETKLQTLSIFPERCALAPENALVPQEIRQLIYGRRQGIFRALFTIVDNEVRILHVRRATQNCATADDLNVD